MRFTDETMLAIISQLDHALNRLKPDEILAFDVVDPDRSSSHFAGETIAIDGVSYCYRPHQAWMELAEQLGCRYLTPHPAEAPFVTLRFARMALDDSWHQRSLPSGSSEKYGSESDFFRIHKLEEPSFLIHYMESLSQLALPEGARVLNLGINRGDEWLPFGSLYTPEQLDTMTFVGVDHAASALAVGSDRFRDTPGQYEWIEADLNDLDSLDLGRFDLVISVGTLHSPKLRSRDIFCGLVQRHLTPKGHVLLGFPNCRYIDHLVRYGAQVKNYTRPELSVLWKEVAFHKRYLQQHKFRVTVTGKHTVFVTGLRQSP